MTKQLADRPYEVDPKATSRGKSKEYPINMEVDLDIAEDVQATIEQMDNRAWEALYGDEESVVTESQEPSNETQE